MYKVKTMNNIAPRGIEVLTGAGLTVSADEAAPDALLIRSARLHDTVFNPELLCIGRAGIGVDNIPVERCAKEGIAVFSTPGANAEAVKELVVCSLLLASRDIVGGVEWVQTLSGEGEKIPTLVEKGKSAFVGPEISGKRLGVIGLGAIGSRVAKAALQLDMEVCGYDPYLSVDAAWNLSSRIEHVRDLSQLFQKCDYITMHLHVTPETHHIIDREAIAKMKPGMRVLNFARGELVDNDAMAEALATGQIARYVTDFPNERFMGLKNVVAMPHLGASTPESEEKCAVMAAREVADYLKNGNIRNSVNMPDATLDRLGESRLCLLHKNQPKMLNQFLELIAEENINVEHMLNKARGELAYTIFDTSTPVDETMAEKLRAVPDVYRVRLL